MKRQSLVLLAVAFVAAGAAGCFKDPVSGLRGGPSALILDHASVYIATGDSVPVTATLKDAGGNVLAETDAVWATANATIAAVRKDTTTEPGNFLTRGFIRGVQATGGITNVTVTSRGLTATVRVIVTPPQIPAAQHGYGTPTAQDTLVIPGLVGPPPTPPDTVRYTAADTLLFTGTAFFNFDTTQVAAYVTGPTGTSTGFITAKTPTALSVVFTHGASGHVWVKHLQMNTGNPAVGVQPIDSLLTADSVLLARVRYRGAITQTGDTVFFALTNGVHFGAATTIAFGANAAYLFDTAGGKAFAQAGYTGLASLTNVGLGGTTLDAISSAAPATVAASAFVLPAGNVTQAGDTLTVTGNALITIDSTTTLAFGAATPTVLKRGANSISVLNGGASYTGVVTAKNPEIGIARIASLKTTGTYTVNQGSFLGTLTQLGDTLTITAPAGMTFDGQTSAAFGAGNAGIILAATATSMKMLSPVTYTGTVQITNALLGTLRVPALVSTTSVTINGASFPSANVSVGAGRLGDTITVTAPAGYSFSTGSSPSNVLAGNLAVSTSDTTWILSRTASTIKAFAKRGGIGPVRVTHVVIPGPVNVPYLTTPTNFTIDSLASDLPIATSATEATAQALTIGASNTVTVYGATNADSTLNNFWTFTTTASHKFSAQLGWYGSGCPGYGPPSCPAGSPNLVTLTADLDLLICNVGMACDESVPDLLGYAAATAGQPEKGTTANAQPAGQYWVAVIPFTTGPRTSVYQLTVTLQ